MKAKLIKTFAGWNCYEIQAPANSINKLTLRYNDVVTDLPGYKQNSFVDLQNDIDDILKASFCDSGDYTEVKFGVVILVKYLDTGIVTVAGVRNITKIGRAHV